LRPADYGVYAVVDDSLAELQLLRAARPICRDAATNISDRAKVRVVARIAREFSAEAAGKKPDVGDSWVIRNISFSVPNLAAVRQP
jgi:hypothetical protein